MTRHDWVGNVIHWKLRKKFKFDRTNKCYMQNTESSLEYEAHTLLKDFFKYRLSNLNQMIRPCDSQQQKETCRIVDFTVAADNMVKLKEIENKKK